MRSITVHHVSVKQGINWPVIIEIMKSLLSITTIMTFLFFGIGVGFTTGVLLAGGVSMGVVVTTCVIMAVIWLIATHFTTLIAGYEGNLLDYIAFYSLGAFWNASQASFTGVVTCMTLVHWWG